MMGAIADKYRQHREEFELAQQLGVTPIEARAELEKRRARERWQTTHAKLEAKMNAPLRQRESGTGNGPAGKPWMMQD